MKEEERIEEEREREEKAHMSVVFIGHVDAGKSTTISQLIDKCGASGASLEMGKV